MQDDLFTSTQVRTCKRCSKPIDDDKIFCSDHCQNRTETREEAEYIRENYTFYDDPGHGWLQVKIKELIQLGIEKQITSYSYMKGFYAYLEEDQDLSTFLDAKYGEDMKAKQFFINSCKSVHQEHTPIRNYGRYRYLNGKDLTRIKEIRGKMLQKFCNTKDNRTIKNATIEDLEYWNTHYKLGVE